MTNLPPFTVLNSEVRLINSKSIEYDFQVSIVKPASYNPETGIDFPCLFVLDPGILQVMLAGISQYLNFTGFQEFITIGVGPKTPHPFGYYNDWLRESFCTRFRDYTPGTDESVVKIVKDFFGYTGEFGGASNYLQFIKNEIMPYVNEKYLIDNDNLSIMGHSMGGLFVLFTLFQEPDLFKQYVSLSPMLSYSNNSIFDIEESFSLENKILPKKLYLSIGSEEDSVLGEGAVSSVMHFADILKSREFKEFKICDRLFEGYSHNDVLPIAVVEALKFLYAT